MYEKKGEATPVKVERHIDLANEMSGPIIELSPGEQNELIARIIHNVRNARECKIDELGSQIESNKSEIDFLSKLNSELK